MSLRRRRPSTTLSSQLTSASLISRKPFEATPYKVDEVTSKDVDDPDDDANGIRPNSRRPTCFDLFHRASDLQVAHEQQHSLLLSQRTVSRESGKNQHSRRNAKKRPLDEGGDEGGDGTAGASNSGEAGAGLPASQAAV